MFAICSFLQSCQKEDIPQLSFIGDSIVEVWDVQEYFPSYYTKNYGRSSTGTGYIIEHSGQFIGKDLVVLTGGNDMEAVMEQMEGAGPSGQDVVMKDYTYYYVQTINGLQARRVYLYSLLPLGEGQGEDIDERNQLVVQLNAFISQEALKRGWVYINAYTPLLKDNRLNPEFSRDGRHLNRHGYDVLAQLLRQHL